MIYYQKTKYHPNTDIGKFYYVKTPQSELDKHGNRKTAIKKSDIVDSQEMFICDNCASNERRSNIKYIFILIGIYAMALLGLGIKGYTNLTIGILIVGGIFVISGIISFILKLTKPLDEFRDDVVIEQFKPGIVSGADLVSVYTRTQYKKLK